MGHSGGTAVILQRLHNKAFVILQWLHNKTFVILQWLHNKSSAIQSNHQLNY